MKIVYIGGSYEGCYYYRCDLPVKFIKKYECYGDIDMDKQERTKTPEMMQNILSADAVVMQRPQDPQRIMLAYTLYQKGKKIIFENDDTMHIDRGNPCAEIPHNHNILENVLRNAHLVTTTTETLAEEYRNFNPNVAVIPNQIDFSAYPDPEENKSNKVRIGFVGSVNYKENTDGFQEVINALAKDDRVKVVVFGLPSRQSLKGKPKAKELVRKYAGIWKKYPGFEFASYVKTYDYPRRLAELKLDIMLIPRKDDYFNRCKSNVKFLEASALKIPCLAQKFSTGDSPYEKDIVEGENGMLADKNEEWLEKIDTLVKDKDLRKRIGENAYDYVKANYDMSKNYVLWEETYSRLLSKIYVPSLSAVRSKILSPFKGRFSQSR